MHCELCHSGNQAEFTAEMMIHFSGLENIDNPGIPALPKVTVCLECGFSRFSITEPELSLLAEGIKTVNLQSGKRVAAPGELGLQDCAEVAGFSR